MQLITMDKEQLESIEIFPLFSSPLSSLVSYTLPNSNGVINLTKLNHRTIVDNCTIDNGRYNQKLFADDLWPGAVYISDYLGKSVLELGAGYMALPSMVCVKLNAKKVTITDFPSSDILDNIWKVLEINEYSKNCSEDKSNVIVSHLEWGNSDDINRVYTYNGNMQYDVIIQAELLWKDTYGLHDQLLLTTNNLLASDGIVICAFGSRLCNDGTNYHTDAHNREYLDKAKEIYNFSIKHIDTFTSIRDPDNSIVAVDMYIMQRSKEKSNNSRKDKLKE